MKWLEIYMPAQRERSTMIITMETNAKTNDNVSLRPQEEQILRKLIDGDGLNDQCLTNADCDEKVILHLEAMGYIVVDFKSRTMQNKYTYFVKLTENGKYYFQDKADNDKRIKSEQLNTRVNKFFSIVAYLITTGIAIAALVVSIIK